MTIDSKPASRQKLAPRGRQGGRTVKKKPDEKLEQANVCLPAWMNKALRKLIPLASDRNRLFAKWVRAYVIANGESDRLLVQSPVSAKILAYLEDVDAPIELRDELQLLLVQRDSDEIKIAEGVTRTKNDSYII